MEIESENNLLAENLIKLGFNPETKDTKLNFYVPEIDKLQSSRFVVAKLTESIYLVASDSYGPQNDNSARFTGLYTSTDFPIVADYEILKKDWFNSLLFFKKKKVGIDYIDKNLTILSTGLLPSIELNFDFVSLFLDINKNDMSFKVVIKNDYLPQINLLKEKKIIGIETNQWLYKLEDLEILIDLGTKIISNLKHAYS